MAKPQDNKKVQDVYDADMVYGIGRVYISMINVMSVYLKDYGLTPTDMNILMLVKHQAGSQGISQVDLGQKLMVTAHNMTRAIQRLEKIGLLKRVSHKKDARINLVTITVKGSQLLDRVWPGYKKNLHGLASNLSLEDQKALTHLLQKWLNRKGA
jgi:MarR family 2-MHQ and catechol resistance regulon transcriptional repressor